MTVNLDLTGTRGAVGDLGAGYEGIGSLTIQGGVAVASANGYLGYMAGSAGTGTVSGPGSTWTIGASGTLYIGYYGTGVLSVTNGGTVRSGSSYVGYTGTGTLNITNGGTVSSSSRYIGYGSGSTGTVTVDGAGSTWATSNELYVGEAGNGTLNITNGGTVLVTQTTWVAFSNGGTGTVTVSDPGSTLSSGNLLLIGQVGAGTLNITNGGVVNSSESQLGNGGPGTATVSGSGSRWNSGDLGVGSPQATGTLNISNGGTVVVTGTTSVNAGAINFGTNGGTLTTGSLYVSPTQVTGTGTINTCGLVADGNMVFDTTHGPSQILTWNSAGQNVTVHLDLTGTSGAVGDLGTGFEGIGSLTIQAGVTVTCANGYLGYNAGATGTATVCGPGSTWICGSASTLYSGSLWVGFWGTGRLNIVNGGTVSSDGSRLSTGTAMVDGPGSTWNSGGLAIGVGPSGVAGTGTLSITNGGTVSSSRGQLGDNPGSTGTVIVDGAGSKWTVGYELDIGDSYGTGALRITNGGTVSSGSSYVGGEPYSNVVGTGTVTVEGPGSTWNSGSLAVGYAGIGTLNIISGGTVTASSVSIGSLSSLVSMTVGDRSALNVGTGSLSNGGIIRFEAAPGSVSGSAYTPIVASRSSYWGTVQAVGGTWNGGTHVFTVSGVISGGAGSGVVIDTSQVQRVVITDGVTGNVVQAGFLATASPLSVTFTATPLDGGQAGRLAGKLALGEMVLGGWTFSAGGYTAGNPVYLSLGIGGGYPGEDLAVWHFDGSGWVPYSAGDLTYDGMYASFTVTGFSGYAVRRWRRRCRSRGRWGCWGWGWWG